MNEIKISPAALSHIQRQLEMTQAEYLRLGVKESGCNGFMYMLDYLEQPGTDDLKFEFDAGVKVCVAAADADMVLGTELDMLTQGLNSALVFKNPKATSYCGCGESFAVGSEASLPNDNGVTDLATNVGNDA